MADEGRLLSPEEARPRRRLAEKARKEIPKISVVQTETKKFPLETRRGFIIEKKVKGTPISLTDVHSSEIPAKELPKNLQVSEPRSLRIGSIRVSNMGTGHISGTYTQLSNQVKNKVLTPAEIKKAATKVSKMLPTIDSIEGGRATGAKVRKAKFVLGNSPVPSNADDLNLTQRIHLNRLRKVAERAAQKSKAGKAFTAALRATRLAKKVLK